MEHGLGSHLLATLAIIAMAILGTGMVQRIMFLADGKPAVAVAYRQERKGATESAIRQGSVQDGERDGNKASLANAILGLLDIRGLAPSSHDATGGLGASLGDRSDIRELLPSPSKESASARATGGPSPSNGIVDGTVPSTDKTITKRLLDLTNYIEPTRRTPGREYSPSDLNTDDREVVVRDTLAKEALSTEPTGRGWFRAPPLYQWAPNGEPTDPRFLTYSRDSDPTNGLAFMILVLTWLRALTIKNPVDFQTDEAERIQGNGHQPLLGRVARLIHPLEEDQPDPQVRGGLGARSEHAYRLNGEEAYRPHSLQAQDVEQASQFAIQWLYFYNLVRPHLSNGMEEQLTPDMLQSPTYSSDGTLAPLLPIVLDDISADVLAAHDRHDGDDLFAYGTPPMWATGEPPTRENSLSRESTP